MPARSCRALNLHVPRPDLSVITQIVTLPALTTTRPVGMPEYWAATETLSFSDLSWPYVSLVLEIETEVMDVALDTVKDSLADADET